jgi:hypothetical protein
MSYAFDSVVESELRLSNNQPFAARFIHKVCVNKQAVL